MYCLDKVESLFRPYEDELVRLYYAHVHLSHPILVLQEIFQAKLVRKVISVLSSCDRIQPWSTVLALFPTILG